LDSSRGSGLIHGKFTFLFSFRKGHFNKKIKIKTNKQTKECEIKRARLKHGILTLQIFKLRDYDWKFNIMINFNNFFHVKFTKIK
jgi:hypothetical protein